MNTRIKLTFIKPSWFFNRLFLGVWTALVACFSFADSAPIRINQIQFVGSHNSYKQAMSPLIWHALKLLDDDTAKGLEYWHLPLEQQLDQGIRKLEFDLFLDSKNNSFSVGHVQNIDMNSHCETLTVCLEQLKAWSQQNPRHVPIWVSFNLKDEAIERLSTPELFTPEALKTLDRQLRDALTDRLILPRDVLGRQWPTLEQSRGKVLLVLDEAGVKRDWYYQNWKDRPMFTNAPEGHEAAAVMVINDPIDDFDRIQRLVRGGYMVRTRADADTREARTNDIHRRDRAFASGAQAISTDYYLPASHFGKDYQVTLDGGIRCNPVLMPIHCRVAE